MTTAENNANAYDDPSSSTSHEIDKLIKKFSYSIKQQHERYKSKLEENNNNKNNYYEQQSNKNNFLLNSSEEASLTTTTNNNNNNAFSYLYPSNSSSSSSSSSSDQHDDNQDLRFSSRLMREVRKSQFPCSTTSGTKYHQITERLKLYLHIG